MDLNSDANKVFEGCKDKGEGYQNNNNELNINKDNNKNIKNIKKERKLERNGQHDNYSGNEPLDILIMKKKNFTFNQGIKKILKLIIMIYTI